MLDILFGNLVAVTNAGKTASVRTLGEQIYPDVELLYPYGLAGNPSPSPSALVLLLKSGTNVFGIPFDKNLQSALLSSEVEVGNQLLQSTISFKSTGDIEINGTSNININSTGIVTILGTLVNLGDAAGFALNTSAVMSVTIPGGSSAGTYPVVITSAGNTKVSV